MKTFVASSPSVEVNGETIYSIIDGMGVFKSTAIKILGDNGIVDPKPGQWYKQQSWLDAFKSISDKVGNSTLNAIGQKIPVQARAGRPHPRAGGSGDLREPLGEGEPRDGGVLPSRREGDR